MTGLPAAVRQALDAMLAGKARTALGERSRAITTTYRGGRNSSAALLSDDDALAYAVARLPATFAAMAHALEQARQAQTEFAPTSLLDVGCGPGTAAMAAAAAFPGLRQAALIDRNGPFLRLAAKLAPLAAPEAAFSVTDADIAGKRTFPPADLVTAGYVLAELAPAQCDRLIADLWGATRSMLVLAEPGTPQGFARLKRAREMLIAAGAHVVAPCTHHGPCPMAGVQFCRTPVRVQRSRDHRALKGGALAYEDEPVAYLAVSRAPPAQRPTHRIIGPAVATKIGITLPGCGPAGLGMLHAPRRDRELHRRFRKLDWGDAVLNHIQPPEADDRQPAHEASR